MTLNFGFDFYLGLSRLILLFSLVGFGSTLFYLFIVIANGVEDLTAAVWFIVTLVALFGIFFFH